MPAKQRIVLLVLLLFGLPAVITTVLLTTHVKPEVRAGMQPGGLVRGTVKDETGSALAGIDVVAYSLAADAQPARLGMTQSDGQGRFQLMLPAVNGRYELRFSGAEWQAARVEIGFLDPSGVTKDPGPLDVRLQPGASLEVEIVRANGAPAGAGSFELEGTPSAGFFSSWNSAQIERSGSFDNGSFTVQGLPPVHGRLLIHMASGDRIDSTLDLAPGKNHHKVQL